MTDELYRAVDRYLADTLVDTDPVLDAALDRSRSAGLPEIQVASNQGKLLQLLALGIRARRILEVGTLGGYSTIWLARSLPRDGLMMTLELDPAHAEVAVANLQLAGLEDLVEVRVGRAADSLADISGEGHEPFDLVFIDADKPSNPEYFRWALRLCRPGGLIIVDNVVRGGAVANADSDDDRVHGTRAVLEMMAAEPRVQATAVQTVGEKGHDGFALCVVTED